MVRTKNVRADLHETMGRMAKIRFNKLVHQCLVRHFYDKTHDGQVDELERLRSQGKRSLLARYCKRNEHGQAEAIGFAHASLISANFTYKTPFDEVYHFPNDIDILAKTYRVPFCLLEDMLDEFPNSYSAESYNCLDLVEELHSSKFTYCKTLSFLQTVFPDASPRDFRAGIALKLVREAHQPHVVQSNALKVFSDSISTSEERKEHFECLFHGISEKDKLPHHRILEESCKDTLTEDLSLDMDLAYRLAKQYVPQSSRLLKDKGELNNAMTIKKVLHEVYGYNTNNDPIYNDYAVVLACKFGHKAMEEDCGLFSNTFSSVGFGYTFNAQPYWTLFKNTSESLAFYKEIYEQQYSFEDDLPRKIVDTGHTFSFEFIVRHKPYDTPGAVHKYDQEMFLAIHDPSHVPNLKNEGIKIDPGKLYEIRINPILTMSDESALALDSKTRNCLSKDENMLSLFRHYSQSACILECKLDQAVGTCNCSALEYPRVSPDVGLCLDMDSSKCFSDIMGNDTLAANCDCPNDCDHIVYDTDMQITTYKPRHIQPKE